MFLGVVNVAAGLGAGTAGGLDWRYFAAGGISAALSHGYTTPVDVVKTRMQTNPELYNGSVPVAVRRILEDEGALFLLQGLAPTCIGYGVEGALKFGCYELCKPLFATLTSSDFVNLLLASTVAGAIASVVLCPAEDVRIRLVSDPSYAPGAVAALSKIAKTEGTFSSFKSLPAMLAKQVPYTMGKQVSFDFFCELAHGMFAVVATDALMRQRLDGFTPVVAALPSAIIACVLSHPGDAVLTEYTSKSQALDMHDDVLGSLLTILGTGGFKGLFTGIKARLLHIIGILWIQLVIYDKLKQLLGLPATGH